MGFLDFLKKTHEQKQARNREQEKERLFQLNYRFPLSSLPDELIEFIFRLVITNYGLDVFRKLLNNVPELRKKILLVSDTDMADPYLRFLSAKEDVPRTDIKSYELSLTLQPSQQQPLIVLFTFLTYHMDHSGMFTTLTRFIEDGQYAHLITKSCILALTLPRLRDSELHRDHNPSKYLKSLAALRGAQVIELKTHLEYFHPLTIPKVISNPVRHYHPPEQGLNMRQTLTFKENSGINWSIGHAAYPHNVESRVYICNIQTEMRHGQDRSGRVVRWRSPTFVRQRELRVLMNENCTPTPERDKCVERLIELGDQTGYDSLHIEYLCPKMPLIIDSSLQLAQYGWFTARNLVIDNLNWSYKNPYGKVCEAHAGAVGSDQHSWSLSERHPDDDRLRIRCSLMLLIGITDRFLEYSRWGLVTVLYWKRLEPSSRIRDYYEKRPVVIHCPSLTLMKIFSIVRKKENERAHFPQFNTPKLEQLVLVSLKESERCWNVKRLLNNEWPETLRLLTLSSHHMSEGPVLNVSLESLPPKSVGLSHLSIQRMTPDLNGLGNLRFTELRYLEIDITVIPPTVVVSKMYELAINILIEEDKFPAIKTLILSVPHRANETHNFAIPVSVIVPKSCETVGVASMLVHSTVRVNGSSVEFCSGFNAVPRMEVFATFVRDGEGRFVHGEKLMAEKGRSLDTCLEMQWQDFDMERTPVILGA